MSPEVVWVGHRASDALTCLDDDLWLVGCASLMGHAGVAGRSINYEDLLGRREPWSSNDQGLAGSLAAQLIGEGNIVIVPFRADGYLSSTHPKVASIPPALFASLSTRRMMKTLGDEGVVRTPQMAVLADPAATNYDDLARLLGLPFIVKGDGSVSGSECFVVDIAADLDEARRHCDSRLNTAWEYVPGPSVNFHFLCFDMGTAVLPPSAQLLTGASNQRPFQFAGSDFATNCPDETLAQAQGEVASVAKALQRRGYRGFGGLDLVLHGDGRAFAVDLNPRLQGSTLPLSRALRTSVGFGVGKLQIAACEGAGSDLLRALVDVPLQAPDWGGQVIVRNETLDDVRTTAPLRDGVYARTGDAWSWRTDELSDLNEGELLIVDCAKPGIRIRSGGLVCRALFGPRGRDEALTFASGVGQMLRQTQADNHSDHEPAD